MRCFVFVNEMITQQKICKKADDEYQINAIFERKTKNTMTKQFTKHYIYTTKLTTRKSLKTW